MPPQGESGPRGPEQAGVSAAGNMDIRADHGAVAAGAILGDVTIQNHHYAARPEVKWPHTVGPIPQQAQSFQLRAALAELEPHIGSEASAPCLVLDGLGGIGKTQLAAFYARRARDNNEIELLVWVNAATRDSITYWLAEAANDLRGADPAHPEQAAKAFLAWLHTQRGPTGRRWLLVFDDLANPRDLEGLPLPIDTGSSGRILITTRRKDAALNGEGYHHVDVGLFSPDEAHNYLVRSMAAYGRDDEEITELRELAKDLGNLPLALGQAAAYMAEYRLSAAQYRLRLADARYRLGQLFSGRDRYDFTVATTWTVSVEAANELPPRGLSRPLLTLASVLGSDGIPVALFATGAARRFLAGSSGDGDAPEVTADMARDALWCLQRLSLVSIGPDAGRSGIEVHSLVQRTSLDQAAETDVQRAVRAAADALMEIWPLGDTSPGHRQMVRQNALCLVRAHFDLLWEPGHGHHEILSEAGRALADAGQPAEAMAFFEMLADASDHRLGPSHLSTLRARASVGSYRGHAGNPGAAVRALGGVLSDLTPLHGPEHPDTLNVRARLAYWQGRAGDLAGAIRAFEELYEVQRRVPDDPETFRTRASLASFRGQAGDSAAAAEAFLELLADEERVFRPDHPNVLETRRSLAKYLYPDAPAAAVRALRQLVADHEQVLSRDHPDTLSTRFNLALAQARAGDRGGAAAALTKLLADRERILGPDHPATLATRYRLHLISQQAGQCSRAAATDHLRELLDDQVRVLGHDHPDTLRTRALILSWRKPGRALPGSAAQTTIMLEELVADQRRVLGPRDLATLNTKGELASWRGRTGDPAGAARDFNQLVADLEKTQGPRHHKTLSARSELHRWLGEAGDHRAAATAARNLYDVQVSLYGVDDPRTRRTFSTLISYQRSAATRDGVVDALSEEIRHQAEQKGPEDRDTLSTRTRLAWELLRAGHAKRARQELSEVIPFLTRVLGPYDEQTLKARFYLACYYDTAGYWKRAGDEFKAVLKDQRRHLGKTHPGPKRTESAIMLWRDQQPVVRRPPVTGAGQATTPPLIPAAPRRPVRPSSRQAAAATHESLPEDPDSTAGLLAAVRKTEPLCDGYLESRLRVAKLDAEAALETRRWLSVALTHPDCLPGRTGIADQYADALADVLAILGKAGTATVHGAVHLWLLRSQPDLASYEIESKAKKMVRSVYAAIVRDLRLADRVTLPPLDMLPGRDDQHERTVRRVMFQVVGLISALRLQAALEDILTTAIELSAKAADRDDDAEDTDPASAPGALEEPGRPVLPPEAILAAEDLARTFGLPHGTGALRQALVHRSWHPSPGKPVPSRFTNTALATAGTSVVNALVACGVAQSVIATPTTLDLRSLLWAGDETSSFSTVFDTLRLSEKLVSGQNGRPVRLDDTEKALTARAVLTAACVSRESDLLILPESLPDYVRDWLALVVQDPATAGQPNRPEYDRGPLPDLQERTIHLFTVSPGQPITLGRGVSMEVSEITGESVRLRFRGPDEVVFLRREIWEKRRSTGGK
jgi:tetratricopeptide (TPR) repeat protein